MEKKVYKLGNQPEKYSLTEDYLGWIPEGGDWTHLCIQRIKNTKMTIINPVDGGEKELFLHHFIAKSAFPLSFFEEERATNWSRFAIVSHNETSKKFIIPLH